MDGPVQTTSRPTPEEIVRDYGPRVYSLARRMLGNDADAEDVTQDVLLQAYRKLPTFRGESAFPTWLHRIAVNAALRYRQRRAALEDRLVPEPPDGFTDRGSHAAPVRGWSVSPEQQALEREQQTLIEAAIDRLPEIYRDIYVLSDVEEIPNAEIADELGLSVPAVKSRLHRARLLMRAALAPHFEESLS